MVKRLTTTDFQPLNNPILSLCFTEKMISSEALEGVPLLVLANKQDVEVSTELHILKCHTTLEIAVYVGRACVANLFVH